MASDRTATSSSDRSPIVTAPPPSPDPGPGEVAPRPGALDSFEVPVDPGGPPSEPSTDQGAGLGIRIMPLASAAPEESSGTAPSSGTLSVEKLGVYYGAFRALKDVTLPIHAHAVTAIIGPSGCGKSTFIRTLNRMHELVRGAHIEGTVRLDGEDIYDPAVDPVELRRVVGMVFQRPNPFPTMTIWENVVSGVRLTGSRNRADLDVVAERSLRRAALWDEVKDKLKQNALALSGGQQQRLCIARALAVEPEVILMDEPASALDPIATLRIEELIGELRASYTIVIVTHNMQQAARVSDTTAFFTMGEDRAGYLVEAGPTRTMFTRPRQQLTEDYVSGRFG
jgi:phosphate transport system ATP-binding protein